MKRFILIMLTIVKFSFPIFAQKSEVFMTPKGAIQGYDPVAYFREGKPVEGKKTWMYTWKGANWYFSTPQNRDAFKANPEKFAPQYGGYCAYGTAEGHKAPTDPLAWTIVNHKLYLNYNQEVKGLWSKDQKGYIKTADKKWPQVSKQE